MKKIILLAAFGVAGLVSGKDYKTCEENAKKDKKVEQKATLQQCGVQITYYYGGQVTGVETIYSDQPNLESCQKWQTGVKLALWYQGFWLTGA